MLKIDLSKLNTPCYVVDEQALTRNLEILEGIKRKAGCKILLAQKAFSMFSCYPQIMRYLDGTTASGLYEAILGREEGSGEVHVFSPGFTDSDFPEILKTCDHIVFNSMSQWQRFSGAARVSGKSFGLRINPEHSTQTHGIYDPCSVGSRLGITLANMPERLPEGIDGLHFHTLCEQGADALAETLAVVRKNFDKYLRQIKWINLGGGHHITRDGYDKHLLISLVSGLKRDYDLEVYLEPGEAVALDAGYFVTEVLDITQNGGVVNAILDGSAACHMPDIIEMPYRPRIIGGGQPNEKKHTYRLGGGTCLAGDIIGDYSFDTPLEIGSRLTLCDMAIYSMVKNNTFNGMPLPSIYTANGNNLKLIKQFSYNDFKQRLS